MNDRSVTFIRDGVRYEWHGGFGAIFKSYERRRVQVGDVRVIAGMTFYASYVYPRRWRLRREVCWTTTCVSVDAIRVIQAELLR